MDAGEGVDCAEARGGAERERRQRGARRLRKEKNRECIEVFGGVFIGHPEKRFENNHKNFVSNGVNFFASD